MDYNVSVQDTGNISRNINIEVPKAVFEKRFNDAVGKTASRAQIKGFRRGKAPRKVIEKMYGAEIRKDLLEEIWREGFERAVDEHSLRIVGIDGVKVDEEANADEQLKFIISVALLPEPQIGSYWDVDVNVKLAAYKEETLANELDGFRRRFAKVDPVEGRDTVVDKDLVNFSYEATAEGEVFDKNESAYAEIGSKRWPADLESKLVGLKVNEPAEIQVHLPDNFENEKVAGKDANYRITVKTIYSMTLAELDDELAKKTGIAQDLEGLKTALRERMQKDIEQTNAKEKDNALFRAISDKNPFDLPQLMIDNEIREILMELGALDPQKRESLKADVSGFRSSLGMMAEFRVRRTVIIRQILKQEARTASDEDINSWLEEKAGEYGTGRDVIEKAFPDRASLKDRVVHDKMVAELLQRARITEITE